MPRSEAHTLRRIVPTASTDRGRTKTRGLAADRRVTARNSRMRVTSRPSRSGFREERASLASPDGFWMATAPRPPCCVSGVPRCRRKDPSVRSRSLPYSRGSRSLPGRDRRRAPTGANENVVHEPEFPKPSNNQAIDVDFVPGVRNIGVPRKPMMVVVQPFTEGEDRDHQLVGRVIIELEATVTVATVAMADRVDQRGGQD